MSKLKQHNFEDQEFSNFTKCFVCDELIAQEIVDGIVNNVPTGLKEYVPAFLSNQLPSDKGCTCAQCGLNVHRKCKSLVESGCTEVAHRFEIRSYTPMAAMCTACGTNLQGLYRQGYRCALCGIDVHPGCRTNPLIHKCAALQDQEKEEEDPTSTHEEETISPKLSFETDAEDPTLPSNRRRNKKKQRTGSMHIEHIVVPSSTSGIAKELLKMHTQSRALSVVTEEKWTTQDRPKLMQSKRDLSRYNKKLGRACKAREAKMRKLAQARQQYYNKTLKKLKINDEERKELLDTYSGLIGDEITMLEMLQSRLSSKTSDKIINETKKNGLHVKREMENAIDAYDQIRREQASVSAGLEAVRRELFFPRYNHWFARIAVEGKYAAIGSLWLEKITGAIAIRIAMIEKSGTLVPTVVFAICGVDTPVNISAMGMPGNKENKRHKLGTKGAVLTARIESLSVSERNLGVSFVLDEVKLELEIFLNMEMEYHVSKKTHKSGKWNLKSNLIKFEKFGLTFKAGALSLPDSVLQLVIRNILTSGIKQAVRSALSPELGNYMLKLHEYRKTIANSSKMDFEQFRFYAKADINADLPLDALMLDISELRNPKKKKGNAQKRYIDTVKCVTRALGLDENQLELLIRTQEEIGLTKTSAFPDESLRALGVKAIQNLNVQGALESNDASALNVQGVLDAANKIGLKVLSGELISENPPLLSILDLVRYVRTYFGETTETRIPGEVFAPRIAALWQGALDLVAKNMSKGSFRSRLLRAGSSKEVGNGLTGLKIDFVKLIERIRSINGKKLHTHLQVMDLDVKFGVRGLLNVGEAKAVQANLKSKTGGALLFELRHTKLDEDDDDDDGLEKINSMVKEMTLDIDGALDESESSINNNGLFSSMSKTIRDDSTDNQTVKEEDDIVLVSSLVKGGFQKETREKAEKIKTYFADMHNRLTYIHEKLFNSLTLQLHGFVGNGTFDVECSNVKTVIDNQFRLKYRSSIFGFSRRDNSWPWRRKVRAVKNGFEAVVVRVIDRADGSGPERTEDPEKETNLSLSMSKMQGTLVPRANPGNMTVSLLPNPADENSGINSWQEPGHLSLEFDAPRLSFEGEIPFARIFGGLENLHDYAADILKWKLESANVDDSKQKASQTLLRKVMKYAQLNTFEGSLSCHVEVETSDEELYIRVSKSSTFPEEHLLTMDVENDFVQFTDDVAHILQQFRVDPLAK